MEITRATTVPGDIIEGTYLDGERVGLERHIFDDYVQISFAAHDETLAYFRFDFFFAETARVDPEGYLEDLTPEMFRAT